MCYDLWNHTNLKIIRITVQIFSLCLILLACGEDPAIKRGKELVRTGDTAAAIQQFESVIRQNSSDAEAYYQLGLAYEELKDATQATDAFKNAQRLAPQRPEIALALGRLHWHTGNRDLAISQFQNLLSNSLNEDVHLQLAALTGDAYHVQRLRTEGSDDYEQTFTEKGNMMTFTAKYTDDYSPAISPDGKWLAFASNRLQNAELYLMDLNTRSLRQLTHTDELDEYMPAFSPDGKSLAFVTERTRGGMMLPPVQASGSDPSSASIYLMDIDGRNQRPVIDIEGAHRAPVFSPDGKRIAFESRAPTRENGSTPGDANNDDTLEIYIIQTDGTNQMQLTHNTVDDGHPTWAPDGRRIAFTSMVEDVYQIFVISASGGTAKQLTFSNASHYQPTFSRDGKRIIYISSAHNHYTLWMMNADGTNKTQLTSHVGAHFEPSLSGDGKTLVFSSDRSDHMRIYLMDLAQSVQEAELKARLAGL
ncbi:MAG: tetratricopeptide repeat protein [Candidatus Poribacteria bacterium]|nr:tetratricopeptide repeat protein [Candidatus Poribacteria bacterium]